MQLDHPGLGRTRLRNQLHKGRPWPCHDDGPRQPRRGWNPVPDLAFPILHLFDAEILRHTDGLDGDLTLWRNRGPRVWMHD